MKQFLIKLILFGSFCILFTVLINRLGRNNSEPSDFLASIIDKHQRVQEIQAPKIIIAGGSHLAFGIDSEMIERAFAVPVVNLGINGGLGASFMIEEIKHVMQPNDVVLLSFAYLHTNAGIPKLNMMASDYYPPASNFYHVRPYEKLEWYFKSTRMEYLQIVDAGFAGFMGREPVADMGRDTAIYSRAAFNKHGDVIAHLEREPRDDLLDREIFEYQYWEGIQPINQFGAYANGKGVHVFYFYGNLTDSEYAKNQRVIKGLAEDIERDLTIPLLGKHTDYVFPDKLFFDSVYHLNKKGRAQKTEKLIEFIKKNKHLSEHLDKIRTLDASKGSKREL